MKCPISIYSSPNAVPVLHYEVPIEGVEDPVSIYVHRSSRHLPPLPYSSKSKGNQYTVT